jgi:hypothetical protein
MKTHTYERSSWPSILLPAQPLGVEPHFPLAKGKMECTEAANFS